MLRLHRTAIARIFSDLIKADRIINVGEMDCWQKICSKYAIDKEIQADALNISFADAIEAICSSGVPGLKKDFLGDCRAMTISDGFCAHSEALIMIALMLMLDPSHPFKTEVYSIPKANFDIDIATALYIESYFDADTNKAIEKNYRVIFKEFQLAGFHFIYPPNIINHYRHTDSELFHRILTFIAPALSENAINTAADSLMNMTTEMFCKDVLCNKCGISRLRGTFPSIIIKIGNSYVAENPYANYLKIEIDENILETIRSFVDTFREMMSGDVYVVSSSEEKDSQFHFHGFYKQLLEIFLIRRDIRSSILIDTYKETISFPELDIKLSGLHRREKALYALLLCQGKEGLNFNLPTNRNGFSKYNAGIEKIQNRYAAIYSAFGGDPESAPNLRQAEIRRPIFSCLKRSLKNVSSLYNPQDYNVSKDLDNRFSVNVEPSLVFITEFGKDTPVSLHQSKLYREIMNLQ